MEKEKGKYYNIDGAYATEIDESKVIIPNLDDLLPKNISEHFYYGLRIWVDQYQTHAKSRGVGIAIERSEAKKLRDSTDTLIDFLKEGGMPPRLENSIWMAPGLDDSGDILFEKIEAFLEKLSTDLKQLRDYVIFAQGELSTEKGKAGRPSQDVRDMVLYYVYWRLLEGGVKTKSKAMRDAAEILRRCGIPAPGGATDRIAQDNIAKRIRIMEQHNNFIKSHSKKAVK